MNQNKTYLALLVVVSLVLLAGCMHNPPETVIDTTQGNDSNEKEFLTNYTINNTSWVTRADWNYTHSNYVLEWAEYNCRFPREDGYSHPYGVNKESFDETPHNYTASKTFLLENASKEFPAPTDFWENTSLILTDIKPRNITIRDKTINIEKAYRPDAIYYIKHKPEYVSYEWQGPIKYPGRNHSVKYTLGIYVKYKGPHKGTTIHEYWINEECDVQPR